MKTTMLRLAGGVLLLLSMSLATADVRAQDEPQDIVKQTTERVLQALRTEGDALKKDRQRLYALINGVILPHFDFLQMSKWVLGRHWQAASESQRAAFAKQFELLLVSTYSEALAEFRDESVDFLPTRDRSDTEVAVRSAINRGSGGPPVPISYQMHKVDGAWKVFDVVIDGVSLVINYRSSFAQEIKRNGLDGLIQRLVEKNQASRG